MALEDKTPRHLTYALLFYHLLQNHAAEPYQQKNMTHIQIKWALRCVCALWKQPRVNSAICLLAGTFLRAANKESDNWSEMAYICSV